VRAGIRAIDSGILRTLVLVLVRSKGYEELYAHLAAWDVHVGERLSAGQVIATTGCTGGAPARTCTSRCAGTTKL
jgi:hypothetical protein